MKEVVRRSSRGRPVERSGPKPSSVPGREGVGEVESGSRGRGWPAAMSLKGAS